MPRFRIVDMNNILGNVKNRRRKKTKLPGAAVACVVVGFVVLLMFVVLMHSRNTIREKQAQLDAIEAQCAVQEMENEALRNLINNSDDDEYIERKAREELDFVLPGERVYIITSGN